MCGHPPELEMLCDECFSKNRHHECDTCTYFTEYDIDGLAIVYCNENDEEKPLPKERKCFLYAPKFCKECTDGLDRLCFCCGVQFDEPVDGCCIPCREGDHESFESTGTFQRRLIMAKCSCCGDESVNENACEDCLKIPDWFGCPTPDTPEDKE